MTAKTNRRVPTGGGFISLRTRDNTTSDGCTQKGEAPINFLLGPIGLQSIGKPRLRRGKTAMTPRKKQTADRDVPTRDRTSPTRSILLALALVASNRSSSVGSTGSSVSGGVGR